MEALIKFFGNHLLLSVATLIVLALVLILEWVRTKRNSFSVSPTEAIQMINQNAIVIDMRNKEDYQGGHIINSLCIAPETITSDLKKLDKHRSKPIIIVSQQPNMSQKITTLLLNNGFKAYSLSGGINAWTQAELPLVQDK